jgi:hypothetical protein
MFQEVKKVRKWAEVLNLEGEIQADKKYRKPHLQSQWKQADPTAQGDSTTSCKLREHRAGGTHVAKMVASTVICLSHPWGPQPRGLDTAYLRLALYIFGPLFS